MFFDDFGSPAPRRTSQERKIDNQYMDDCVKAKGYSDYYWAREKRDNDLEKLPSYYRSK